MKKLLKSTLALTLTLIMALSCLILPVGAASQVPQFGSEEINGKTGYLAIGDSIGRGCGSEGSYLDQDNNPTGDKDPAGQYDNYYQRNCTGAYTTLVAEGVGCNMPYYMNEKGGEASGATFWPLCYPGMTTAMMLDLMGVDDGFSDKDLNYPYYKDMLEYFGYEGSFKGVRDDDTIEYVSGREYVSDAQKHDLDAAGQGYGYGGDIGKCGSVKELIENASLITVELGMCDVFYRTYRIATKGGFLAEGAQLDFSDPKALAEVALKQMYTGFQHWKTYYPLLIETIQEWNPDATIVMVGSLNVVNQLRITNDDAVPLGDIFSLLTERMNKLYEQWAEKYGVIFADVRNTEPMEMEEEWSLLGGFLDNAFAGTHPSQKGHDYMARQILTAISENEINTDIKVDLGRFQKVDYVLVNGMQVSDFSMDGFVLNVPYDNEYALNLTVAITDEEGKIALQTYALKYDEDSGYSANRIYGNNDIAGTINKTVRMIFKLLKTLGEKIVGLFKK